MIVSLISAVCDAHIMSHAGTRITPIGPVTITEKDGRIASLIIDARYDDPGEGIVAIAFEQLKEYLDGRRDAFDLELVPEGTNFQKDVWSALMKVPYGETISYSELASLSGHPGACRAVGYAMKMNPIPVFIPCHRVIRNDGSIGGFSLGIDVKRRLMRTEGIL